MILVDVRISYVKLFDAEENLNGMASRGCCVLIPKSDKAKVALVLAEIDAAIEKGVKDRWKGKKPKFVHEPLRDGDAELESGDRVGDEYVGHYFFNCSKLAKYGPIGLLDERKQRVTDPDKFYSGCRANLDVNAFPFANVSNGIGWGIDNAMFVADDDRLDGRQSADKAFESIAPETSDDIEGGEVF